MATERKLTTSASDFQHGKLILMSLFTKGLVIFYGVGGGGGGRLVKFGGVSFENCMIPPLSDFFSHGPPPPSSE